MTETSAPPRPLPLGSKVFRAIVCLGLAGTGVAIAGALVATKPSADRNAAKAPPPRIAAVALAPVEIERMVRGFGSARALGTADVPARVAAVVARLGEGYSPGATVAAGDILVELDASDFLEQVAVGEQAIRATEAQIAILDSQQRAASRARELAGTDRDLAAADLARVEAARAEGAAVDREVDRARQALVAVDRALVAADDALTQIAPRRAALLAQRSAEEARLTLARLSAERCTVRAPIAGVVQQAALRLGESVNPAQTIARLVDLTRIEVPVRIPASQRVFAAPGATAVLRSRAAQRDWVGTVVRALPEDDPATRTATVFVEFMQDPASPDFIAPGTFLEATIASGARAARLVVPRRSIRDEQVVVVEDGRARLRRIAVEFSHRGALPATGLDDEDWAVLAPDGGLAAGAVVVVDGSRSITEGQELTPVAPGSTAPAGGGAAAAPTAPAREGATP